MEKTSNILWPPGAQSVRNNAPWISHLIAEITFPTCRLEMHATTDHRRVTARGAVWLLNLIVLHRNRSLSVSMIAHDSIPGVSGGRTYDTEIVFFPCFFLWSEIEWEHFQVRHKSFPCCSVGFIPVASVVCRVHASSWKAVWLQRWLQISLFWHWSQMCWL